MANAGCTLGGYKSTNPTDPNSWTHFCVHSNGGDDRESGWADNNPSSPHFGNMYVSWNDFNVGSGALEVTFSTDNGATWHAPVTVSNSGFIRDVQITGDMSGNGTIYIAGMDEGGGGFPHNDTNNIFKSTDGGNTWANTYTGTPFAAPGVKFAATTRTSPACFLTPAASGGTRVGVSRQHLTMWFTWSMPSTAPVPILATSITSALATAALPSVPHSS